MRRSLLLAMTATIGLVMAACGGEPTRAPDRSITPSPNIPSTTPTPTAVAYGPATLVRGERTCTIDLGDVTTSPDGTHQHRGGSIVCTVTTDDPRASGREADRWNADRWSEGGTDALVQWGSARLRNDDGTWVGRFTGVYTDETSDITTYWYRGTGGYAGFSLYMAITQPPVGMTWPVTGLIFPGTPPPSSSPPTTPTPPAVAEEPPTLVRGESTCDIDVPDVEADPDGTYRHRGGSIVCTLTSDDPRASGHGEGDFNADRWSERGIANALVQWGSDRLRNEAGSWVGRYAGIYSDASDDIITVWYRGTGGYAGLSLFVATITSPSGSTWPEIGLIFPGPPPPR